MQNSIRFYTFTRQIPFKTDLSLHQAVELREQVAKRRKRSTQNQKQSKIDFISLKFANIMSIKSIAIKLF
jgi:hypothetical protein